MTPNPGASVRWLREAQLDAGPVRLRPLRRNDYDRWHEILVSDETVFRATQPTWSEKYLEKGQFRRRIAAFDRSRRLLRGFFWAVVDPATDVMMGSVQLAPVSFGVERRGVLGYWLAPEARRRGVGTAALAAVAGFAFDHLKLIRLEAHVLPDNTASMNLLTRAGFNHEGRLAGFLEIDGERQDHLLFARLA